MDMIKIKREKKASEKLNTAKKKEVFTPLVEFHSWVSKK